MVTIREDGVERQVTAAEAFVLYLTKKGLEGDRAAALAATAAIEEARETRPADDGKVIHRITVAFVSPGTVNSALEVLRMGVKLDRYRETARMTLEPWLVQAAIAQLGDNQLTPEQWNIVRRATRNSSKVKWPDHAPSPASTAAPK